MCLLDYVGPLCDANRKGSQHLMNSADRSVDHPDQKTPWKLILTYPIYIKNKNEAGATFTHVFTKLPTGLKPCHVHSREQHNACIMSEEKRLRVNKHRAPASRNMTERCARLASSSSYREYVTASKTFIYDLPCHTHAKKLKRIVVLKPGDADQSPYIAPLLLRLYNPQCKH
jgi:hypothetical protein